MIHISHIQHTRTVVRIIANKKMKKVREIRWEEKRTAYVLTEWYIDIWHRLKLFESDRVDWKPQQRNKQPNKKKNLYRWSQIHFECDH